MTSTKDAAKAMAAFAEKPQPQRKMIGIPTDASDDYVRMFHTLKRLAVRGCSRTVPPSTCQQEVAGYPKEEWCEGCIAAEGLGMDREWFQLR